MRVLVVKTSSMGDVVHTLPALTDAAAAVTDIRFDWVVEEAFAEIPSWHPAVDRVIPVAIRRWRGSPMQALRGIEVKAFKIQLRKVTYDMVIDAQGLLKSALIARLVKAPRAGMDFATVRERLAALAYHRRIHVPRDMHAVERVRLLFAEALGYRKPDAKGDSGLDLSRFRMSGERAPNVVFLHGTSRPDKHWPESYWRELCERVTAAGFRVNLPWGCERERARAERIAEISPQAQVLPKLNLQGVASVLAHTDAVVTVDTGLGHLAAALNVPTVALYGPTSPALVGTYGERQSHLRAADYNGAVDRHIKPSAMAPLTPDRVWQALQPLLRDESSHDA